MLAKSTPIMNLKSFLSNQKRIVSNPPLSGLSFNIVIGNDASDADSIITSLVSSYLLEQNRSRNQIAYIPIVCCERKKMHLRRDVGLLLQSVNLSLSDLLCIDEYDLDWLYKSQEVSITLTDHNAVSEKLKFYFKSCDSSSSNAINNDSNSDSDLNDLVVEIIDHHEDANKHLHVKGDKRNIAFNSMTKMADVGSCCTLLAERWGSDVFFTEEIATLLMGVIALDTSNMSKDIGKGTERDMKMYDKTSSISTKNRDDLYILLRDAKIDVQFWHQLSATDAIQLDYKLFDSSNDVCWRIGMSSILQPCQQFVDKANILDAIDTVYSMQDGVVIDIFIVMAFYMIDKTPTRELMIIGHDQKDVDDVSMYLMRPELCMDLSNIYVACSTAITEALPLSSKYSIKCFRQGNIKLSRKQVAPLIISYYDAILRELFSKLYPLTKMGVMGSKYSSDESIRVFTNKNESLVKLMLPIWHTNIPLSKEEMNSAKMLWNLIQLNASPEYVTLKVEDPNFPHKTCAEWFHTSFYKRLFDVHPICRPMFKDPALQGHFLMSLFSFVFTALDDEVKFKLKLKELAVGHCKKGVKAVEYAIIGEVMFFTLNKCLGSKLYNNSCDLAWKKIFSMMLNVIVPISIYGELRSKGDSQNNRFNGNKYFIYDSAET